MNASCALVTQTACPLPRATSAAAALVSVPAVCHFVCDLHAVEHRALEAADVEQAEAALAGREQVADQLEQARPVRSAKSSFAEPPVRARDARAGAAPTGGRRGSRRTGRRSAVVRRHDRTAG